MSALTVWERFAVALQAMKGTIDVKPGSPGYALLSGVSPGGFGALGNPPKRGTYQILLAYSQMPWLRAISGRVADSMSSIQWRLYYAKKRGADKAYRLKALQRAPGYVRREMIAQYRDDLTEVTEHPFFDLQNNANAFHTGHALRKLDAIWLDLIGESFHLIERNPLGMPSALWPLPPSWILSTPTPTNAVFRISYRGYQVTIPASEILWKIDPDPENPYGRGSGLAKTLDDELETDEYAAKHTKSMFHNQAKPDILITAKGMDPAETRRIEMDWNWKNQGYMRNFKAHFLNREVKVHEFNTTDLRAMQFVQLRQYMRDMCMQVWGTPPEIFGVLENSNRATIDGADYLYTSKVIVPRAEFQRCEMQEKLLPQFDERLILDYVSPVAEDKEFALKVAQAAPFSIDVDEWREMGGRKPLDGDKGKLYAIPFSYDLRRELETPDDPAVDDQDDPLIEPADEPVEADDAEEAGETAKHLRRRLKETPTERIARRLEPRMRAAFQRAVAQTRGQVNLEQLAQAIERGDVVAIDVALHVETLARRLGGVADVATQAFARAGTAAATQLARAGLEISFELTNPRASAWAQNNGARMVRDITEETRAAIRTLTAAALEEGKAPRDLARELREVVGLTTRQGEAVRRFREALEGGDLDEATIDARTERYARAQVRRRATNIARTETLGASNNGQQELWRQATERGLLDVDSTRRRWLITDDDRLDVEVCEPMDDQLRGLEEPFRTGDGRDIMLPPAHPQCRCTVSLVFDRKSLLARVGYRLQKLLGSRT